MLRIGIDVGGTHTDAVLLDGDAGAGLHQSADFHRRDQRHSGVFRINLYKGDPGIESQIQAVMLGTTQFTNAVVERRSLSPVAAIRIGLPSGEGLPPMVGWPSDIARELGNNVYMIKGGFLYDGWPLAELDDAEIQRVINDLKAKSVRRVSVASAFSPMNPQPEEEVGRRIKAALPNVDVTLSHKMGRLGILERENASLLNASLLDFADRVVSSFVDAIAQRGLKGRFFVSQNDGTLMDADFARRYPALTFASGPTNSLRGACKLTGLSDAIVVDIGGTTSDIGVLQEGFPRESNTIIEVGGVRTNFRMPDILALGLGGGSLISEDGLTVGPRSVGHQLPTEALVFGGNTLTATDIVVRQGHAAIGDPARVANVDNELTRQATQTMHDMLNLGVEKVKPSSNPLPVVLVGGGAVLVTQELDAASQMLRPEHAEVANAIGAAIAQIGGEVDRFISYDQTPRDQAIAQVTQQAKVLAVEAGADKNSLRVADIEETSISYMANNTTRLRVKVIGEIAGLSQRGQA